MGVGQYIEYGLGKLLFSLRGRDAQAFTNGKAFEDVDSHIQLTSPEVGPTGSHMSKEHTGWGTDRFPELTWTGAPANVKEYLLVVEDPDIPLPFVATHGLFYAIPPDIHTIKPDDVLFGPGGEKDNQLQGPLKLGKNTPGTRYSGPKPVLGHGPHRYFFQLVALNKPLDTSNMAALPTKAAIAKAIEGHVVDWGMWVGVYENKWE